MDAYAIAGVVGVVILLIAVTAGQHRRHAHATANRLCRSCSQSHPEYARFCRKCGRALQ